VYFNGQVETVSGGVHTIGPAPPTRGQPVKFASRFLDLAVLTANSRQICWGGGYMADIVSLRNPPNPFLLIRDIRAEKSVKR
jgi:hypothetical protein